MANLGFFVIGGLGACFLALGLFPAYFGERFVEVASATRIIGFVMIGAAITVRSVVRRQNQEPPEDRG